MANKDLGNLHRAIQEQRYRDAREIIETGDLTPEVAQKWQQWLIELHHEEWSQAGVRNRKARRRTNHSLMDRVGLATANWGSKVVLSFAQEIESTISKLN